MWFGSSKGRKTIHMEMKKQKFGKQMLVWLLQGPGDLERNFNKWALLEFFGSPHLVHTTLIQSGSSLLGTGPLSTFFRQCRGGKKNDFCFLKIMSLN